MTPEEVDAELALFALTDEWNPKLTSIVLDYVDSVDDIHPGIVESVREMVSHDLYNRPVFVESLSVAGVVEDHVDWLSGRVPFDDQEIRRQVERLFTGMWGRIHGPRSAEELRRRRRNRRSGA